MLKLITYPNDILNKSLPDFDFNNPVMNPYDLEYQMIILMDQSNGIGLAANQVGVEARVFVMKTQKIEEIYTPFALFNPSIIEVGTEEDLDEEGCLSFPDLWIKVKRPSYVVAEFFDRDNNKRIIKFEGIDARCFLHELDHLNGTCFIEKVSKMKLDLAIKKQRKTNGRTKQRTSTSV
jgi:peptide deformylase